MSGNFSFYIKVDVETDFEIKLFDMQNIERNDKVHWLEKETEVRKEMKSFD